MVRANTTLAALALLATASSAAVAQERGGVPVHNNPGVVLNKIESLQPGCPLSQTNTAVGVNRATGRGSTAQQQVVANSGPCRPLVSTQVGAGVNVATGQGSSADQSVSARNQGGLLGSTTVSRGVNVAAGRGSSANQGISNVTGR